MATRFIQPQAGPSEVIDSRFTHAWNPGVGRRDLVGNSHITGNTISAVGSVKAYKDAGVKPTIPFTAFTDEFTFFARLFRTTTADFVLGPSGTDYSTGGYFLVHSAGVWYTSRTGGAYTSLAQSLPLNTWLTVVLRHKSGEIPELFLNGVKSSFAGAITGTIEATYFDANTALSGQTTGLVAIAESKLTDSEIAGISKNYWGIFKPANSSLFASVIVPATATTLSGPSSGTTGVASTNFTVGANGTITGTVTVTPGDAANGGTFTPTTVAISSGTPTATFTYTPASTGVKTISISDNGGLTDATSISYTSNAGATAHTPAFYQTFIAGR